ncbi:MAG: L-arabinose isomerase [Endomicrobium sp.]|jgi:L-arabinose isomerase|nr:L-arabinose isomerase [Endomicrobium sp.]
MKEHKYEFWFIAGSQHLYGKEVLIQVEKNARDIVDKLNASKILPYPVVFKLTAVNAEGITQIMKDVNYDDKVAGIITWMHTFSPAKNWIRGTQILNKPLLHLATQYLDSIPYETIDFDYMNLNQSAHGDREYGFINARLGKNNKVVFGHWGYKETQKEIAKWMDTAVGYNESFKIKVARFADNMRSVAVTEGDKVEAQIKFGWTVDYYGVGDLVQEVSSINSAEVDELYNEVGKKYDFVIGHNTPKKFENQVKDQLRIYIALKSFLEEGSYNAFTDCFEDLHGMKQLPCLATQMLMAEGYGFGAEGDWKISALSRLVKIIAHNEKTSFMEDYTLDLTKEGQAILGAHMLEVDPTVASNKARIEVHPLGIGGKEDPARLVFDGLDGDAIDITISDFGNEFKIIGYAVEAKKAKETPKLPVAKQLWTPKIGLKEGCRKWIEEGGGHHSVFSFVVNMEQIEMLTKMFGIKFINIC